MAEQGHQELGLHGQYHRVQASLDQHAMLIDGPVARGFLRVHYIVSEVAPQGTVGASCYAMLHYETSVQDQGGINQSID